MTYIQRTIPKQYTAADTIDVYLTTVYVGGGSATTLILPDPPKSLNGHEMQIKAITQQAHKIDNSAGSGFNSGGASADVASFAGSALTEQIRLTAWNGKWWSIGATGVTIGGT
jgi:hypothetical protein